MARKKIIFVIVEGPSDDTAFGVLLNRTYHQVGGENMILYHGSDDNIKAMLEFIVPRLVRMLIEKQNTVIDLFVRYRVLEYIRNYYEALHTTGRQYIVDDINVYISKRQSLN